MLHSSSGEDEEQQQAPVQGGSVQLHLQQCLQMFFWRGQLQHESKTNRIGKVDKSIRAHAFKIYQSPPLAAWHRWGEARAMPGTVLQEFLTINSYGTLIYSANHIQRLQHHWWLDGRDLQGVASESSLPHTETSGNQLHKGNQVELLLTTCTYIHAVSKSCLATEGRALDHEDLCR